MALRVFFLFCMASVLFIKAGAQQVSGSADAVLLDAFQQAAKENKNVFVIFHASWCGWCRQMEAGLNDPKLKNYFDSHYIIRYLTVQETPENKHLENPGALEVLYRYGGEDQGIPYWLVFDSKGKLLADSRIRRGSFKPGDNTGCPASREEVAYFKSVLKRTSRLTEKELVVIQKKFREIASGK